MRREGGTGKEGGRGEKEGGRKGRGTKGDGEREGGREGGEGGKEGREGRRGGREGRVGGKDSGREGGGREVQGGWLYNMKMAQTTDAISNAALPVKVCMCNFTWKCPILDPNCSLMCMYGNATSTHACMIPMGPAERIRRS